MAGPRSLKSIAAVVCGAAAVTANQLAAVLLLDAGFVRRPVLFYALTAPVPVLVGAVFSGSWRKVVAGTAVVGAATYAFYKIAVQTGRATELGNSLDWAVVLAVTVASTIAGATIRQHWR